MCVMLFRKGDCFFVLVYNYQPRVLAFLETNYCDKGKKYK